MIQNVVVSWIITSGETRKFHETECKRWQWKMFFNLTILSLVKYLTEGALQLSEKTTNIHYVVVDVSLK